MNIVKIRLTPLIVFPRSVFLLLSGRMQFPKDRIGKVITLENGQKYTVFREGMLKPKSNQPEKPDGVFRVWFHTRMSPKKTILLSRLTLFGFLGLPGFRSKLWLYDETSGDLGGIYEWDTVQDADNYDKSYAMKFSKWRSVSGKFKTEVFPESDTRSLVHLELRSEKHIKK